MDTTFSTIHNLVQLPPIDARITPPPEELNIVIPKPETCPPLPGSPRSMPDTPRPDVSSAASLSIPKKQRRPSGSRSRPPRVDVRQQPSTNNSHVFSPRPYENLYAEQAYLAASLLQQSARAADMMRQYSAVDSQLQSLDGDKGRRRLRKQLGLLRSRINAAVEQQQAIFIRLGEVFVEIQSREAQAAHNQAWSIESPSVGTPSVYSAMSPMSYGPPTPTTPLNGASMGLIPEGYFGDYQQFVGPSFCQQEPGAETNYGLETVHEAGEDLPCGPNSGGCESLESDTTPAAPATADAPVPEATECGADIMDALGDARVMGIRERRLSLPCLQNAWPED
ncbi:hypothetical protein ACJ41O_011148 [Fusarium nematophilum]